jgi:hypothetical protein
VTHRTERFETSGLVRLGNRGQAPGESRHASRNFSIMLRWCQAARPTVPQFPVSRTRHRLLDPNNDAVTLSTLQKAAIAVGREIRLELV